MTSPLIKNILQNNIEQRTSRQATQQPTKKNIIKFIF